MNRKLMNVLCLTIVGIVCAGCTSEFSMVSKDRLGQKMRITSDPPGAEVFLMGLVPLGETPLLDVIIERPQSAFLTLKKEGYEDQNLLLKHYYHAVLKPRKPSPEQ